MENQLEKKIMGILDAREERVEKQKKLQMKYGLPCIVVRCNYPGVDKNNPTSQRVIEALEREVEKKLEGYIRKIEHIDSLEGPIGIYIVERESMGLKVEMVEIEENHPYGRLVDIDVYHKDGRGIGRKEVGRPPRRCYICTDTAHVCVRSGKHTLEEVRKYIEMKVWRKDV